MYSIEGNDIVIACIGLGVYIVGKLWMYYNTNDGDKNPEQYSIGVREYGVF